jgi:hypothetical protein
MKRTKLRIAGHSTVSEQKREIQSIVRSIVILRDGGCILRKIRYCEDPVLQADHLITRSNSATYADTRLIVCLCRSCHGWKHWNEKQYDELVKRILPKDRVDLWDRCLKDSWRPMRTSSQDWKMAILYLKNELKSYEQSDLYKDIQ